MKIRTDFVTNSSSSCFIIAKNDNCTYKEIEDGVRELKEDIAKYINNNKKWIYCGEKYDSDIELAIDEIASGIYNCQSCETSMDIGGWHIEAGEWGDDTSDLYENIMYSLGGKFKFPNCEIRS